MTKRLRVIAIVVFMLAICTGPVLAYSEADKVKTITVIDDGVEKVYESKATAVSYFLKDVGLSVSEDDTMDKALDYMLKDGESITIKRAFPVIINLDGVPRMMNTSLNTVGELVEEQNIETEFKYEDIDANTKLEKGMVINLSTISKNTYTKSKEVPFETITRENNQLEYGVEQVVQEGSKGEIQITITETYEGNTLVSSEETGREMKIEPVNTIIEVGTAKTVQTASGNTMPYKKALNVRATAYTGYDPGCTGITASGTPAVYGVIAVDTRVIPLGTKVYIPGYGEAVAEDTGGAIKGNKIDLCYNTQAEAYQWGVRNITIYIIE